MPQYLWQFMVTQFKCEFCLTNLILYQARAKSLMLSMKFYSTKLVCGNTKRGTTQNDSMGSWQPNPAGNKTTERISNLPCQISCQERWIQMTKLGSTLLPSCKILIPTKKRFAALEINSKQHFCFLKELTQPAQAFLFAKAK